MSLVICHDGVKDELDQIQAQSHNIGLFKNNHTPTPGDVLADYTPADFGGYSGLVGLSGWSGASLSGDTAQGDWTPVTWTADGSGAGDVYGYYVVNNVTGKLAWAELNGAGPVTMNVNGQTFTVVPKRTHQNV